ncbi:flavodoxin domain-containing protein [Salirhabdus sp. Marseille-P4669]|uniref:flavodoxin domain-containing protein n=1 Tax=Salirhabdus sp. Marseille-P4669 TaxID=2042310 RepID=UPI000C79A43A|nr:flavodoxin domain-containing protein [Salirhabdus sp. Marseille-P4669]
MKIAIVYTSVTGNTKELAEMLFNIFKADFPSIEFYTIDEFPMERLHQYDGIIIGTYTWGNGNLPRQMRSLYSAFENQETKHIVTGVFGTGDRFYPNFCGAVEHFRDMLYVQTDLAVTLKVELRPQSTDYHRCIAFLQSFRKKALEKLVR